MRDTTTDLTALLKDPSLLAAQAYIAGEWVEGDAGARFDVTNPARGDVIASVANLGRAETKRAINAAETAQKAWAKRTAKDRCAVLKAMHEQIMANLDDLALILTAEMGKPLAEAKGELTIGAAYIEWFAEEAKRVYGENIPGHLPGMRLNVIKQPIGVTAAITPWNFPHSMLARKIAPALAAGCSMVVRPPTLTPLSALAFGVIADRAGLPKGLLSIIPSTDSSGIGKEFCENPIVRKLSFTGSTEVGRILLRQAADQVMKCSMELGGNAPFLVFNDADLDAAVEGAIISKYRNNGQTCVCANRIYVQSGVYDAFAQKLADKVGAMAVGDGLTEGTVLGPLIDAGAVAKVQEHIDDATSKGAKIALGGQAHELGGTFFEPTILTDVTQDMMVSQDETFGPLAPLYKFETEEEAVAMANDTIFGLACYFYARDIGTITRVQEALEYGMVGVNTGLITTEVAPFGGVKQSGLGHEGSHHGIEEYLELKYIGMNV